MTPGIRTKICGLTRPEDVAAAADAGAAYVGFVFFAKSPRSVSFDLARDLAVDVPVGIGKVGLVVDADDAFLDELTAEVPLDFLQLHGHETPERVSEIRARYGLPVIKAVGVADAEDVADLHTFAEVADQLLVDAKPPKNAVLPGGNGVAFDWRLIAARRWSVPWLLAGGLTPDTVAEAIALTGAKQVDVSSGVESAPGVKDASLIEAFVAGTR
ncbi:MAG TPA: phosphoribosylanthranilate isomerase [Marivita sp.]|nr:phosphoribosylanthranilate isomerase [Marivita sp.]